MAMGEETEAAAAATVTAAATSSAPHLLLICFPSQGNVNPMLRLGKRFAAKGLLVTFSSTSDAGAKITASHSLEAGGDGVPLGLGRIRFEFLDDHYDGKELNDLMRHLETTGPTAVAKLLKRQEEAGRPVACVVGNPFIPWAIDVAHGAGIPYAVLWVQSCAMFSLYYHYVHGLLDLPAQEDLDARVKLPGVPALSVTDVPSFLLPYNSNRYSLFTEVIPRQFRTIHKPSWVFVNSFSELERDVVDALPSVSPPPPLLISVGPLVELEEEAAVRGDMIKAANDCVGWLDTQAPRSVVYASFGSTAVLSAEELAEMAHGLASTGRPFLWVVPPANVAMLPEGYLNSIAGRGMVVPWSPQDLVLTHPSTACFLTHCGWNSTLETLATGLPVVAFPKWGSPWWRSSRWACASARHCGGNPCVTPWRTLWLGQTPARCSATLGRGARWRGWPWRPAGRRTATYKPSWTCFLVFRDSMVQKKISRRVLRSGRVNSCFRFTCLSGFMDQS